jgi:hypothetical protein
LSENQGMYGGLWQWTRPLKACAVLAALAMIGLITMLVVLARMPAVRSLAVCREHMAALGGALGRYNDVNDTYPENLNQLRGVFLKDDKVLRCPLDKSQGDAPSYTYRRPNSSSPDTFPMLECDRHRLRRDIPVSKLILQKNQEFTVSIPTLDKPKEKRRRGKP